MRVGDDRCNIIEWNLSKFLAAFARALDYHEAARNEQVASVVSNFDDATDHRLTENPGSRKLPMGSTVTRRACVF